MLIKGNNSNQNESIKNGFQIARQLIYQEDVFNELVQGLQGNPITQIAGTIVSAMLRAQEDKQYSLEVAAAIGVALIDDVFDTLEQTAGIENNPEIQSQVLQEAIVLWLQSNDYPDEEIEAVLQAEGMSPEEIQQMRPQQMMGGGNEAGFNQGL